MSVVGSEVMPLEYGGMDLESSPFPSSSERTVEERRERGVVEEEEEEIPSNIMEVEGNVGRCYDPELNIVSEVRGRDVEVEQLFAWKAKKTKQNNYKLNEDEAEEVGKLVREKGELVDIMYLTSAEAIKATELYGSSSLSEAEIDGFLNAVGGLAIPKKPKKKSKTSTVAKKGAAEKERLSSTST
ncbi:hypothetical protein SLEP1_g59345 [Rubroshorea leprosula]|uniref:Uncharacterized protein n=1 Tax=Rubroshorea leprosula TaxID=152421 RepID=A0AAV5MS18_9ROSI|nr:hypothetical protein SLEP1_g59345 [Rubroshorea leprosula]